MIVDDRSGWLGIKWKRALLPTNIVFVTSGKKFTVRLVSYLLRRLLYITITDFIPGRRGLFNMFISSLNMRLQKLFKVLDSSVNKAFDAWPFFVM